MNTTPNILSRTPDGQLDDILNALQHGLFSAQVVVDAGGGAERPEDFQALNLNDPQALQDTRPILDKLQLRYSGAVWKLPPARMREILLRELPKWIREFDEQEIPAIEHSLESTRKYHRRRNPTRAEKPSDDPTISTATAKERPTFSTATVKERPTFSTATACPPRAASRAKERPPANPKRGP